ncbi:hypothetical protein AB0C52_04780 [Streptomyces sp. NPDC048717]|uniref:hypothetical protein n=1 Tax=Streptomyces sp. NPDC048717 TaxID=3154928 RepID=UPI0034236112
MPGRKARTVRAGAAPEQQVCEGLSPDEHGQLAALLGRLAARQGLTPGVHPGFRSVRADRPARGR